MNVAEAEQPQCVHIVFVVPLGLEVTVQLTLTVCVQVVVGQVAGDQDHLGAGLLQLVHNPGLGRRDELFL